MLLRMTALLLQALPFWIDENLQGHPFYIRSATWTKIRDGPVLKLGSEVGCRIFFFFFCELNNFIGSREKNRDGRSKVNGNIFFGLSINISKSTCKTNLNLRNTKLSHDQFRFKSKSSSSLSSSSSSLFERLGQPFYAIVESWDMPARQPK